MFCIKCGNELPNDVKFCPNCGAAADTTAHTETTCGTDGSTTQNAEFAGATYASSYVDDDVRALIGAEKENYYLSKFAEMKSGNKKATWNWPAFLVTPAWLVYRKMYAYGAIAYVLNILLGEISSVLSLAFAAVMGVFANYIYMTHLEKLALQAKSMHEPAKSQFIAKNKGVSGAAVGLGALAIFVISFVWGLIFTIA